MSVLIKGMEMPDTCFDCPCRDFEFHECSAKEHLSLLKDEYGAEIGDIPNWCPIVEFSYGRWIPFKTRPLTEEERDEHPEWDCILDCKLPDDGQRILVSISLRGHEEVQQDEFYSDDGSYLDSGYEIGTEAVAWTPLPEPYKGGKDE